MVRFVGVKDETIRIISDSYFVNDDLTTIEVPVELKHLSPTELILYCKVINNKFEYKLPSKPINEIKLALVGNYGAKCGIGTYSKFLFDELIPYVKDYMIFTEIENNQEITDKIIPCWKRGEKCNDLISNIKEFNPDIVLLQHEFGLWPNASYWISLLTQLSNYRVIVTMHSVFYHKDKTIVEACIPEIVVHLEGAKTVLKDIKKISSKVYVIPHGCFPRENKDKLWNFYKSNHTIIQAGFLFRYKGWENSLQIIAILKQKYPDVFFTGILSESSHNKIEHQLYYNELIKLTNDLGIQENVGFIRGFQSDEVLDSYFRTNKIAIFPYTSIKEHEVFGVSGIARLAMTKGLPIVSSGANHFNDVPSIKADTIEGIANEIDKLFTDSSLINKQVEIQDQYLKDNSWDLVAKKYIQIFETSP